MADIDHFKRYNDSFGHVGDDCLRVIAACMAQQLRGRHPGTLRRRGVHRDPDGCDELHAAQIAERIRCAVEQLAIRRQAIPGAAAVVTVSIGPHCQPATALTDPEHQLVELGRQAPGPTRSAGCRARLPAG
jgi:GGDEF domain-containing protein